MYLVTAVLSVSGQSLSAYIKSERKVSNTDWSVKDKSWESFMTTLSILSFETLYNSSKY